MATPKRKTTNRPRRSRARLQSQPFPKFTRLESNSQGFPLSGAISFQDVRFPRGRRCWRDR